MSDEYMNRWVDELSTHCNNCGHGTRHKVVQRYEARDVWYGEVDPIRQYLIVECCGCLICSFIQRDWNIEQKLEDDGKWYVYGPWKPDDKSYPKIVDRFTHRHEPSWLHEVEKEYADIMKECYIAIQNDIPTLAAAGARIVLDKLMTELVGDRGTFEQKVDKFIDQGYLARNSRDTILATLDAGSAAIHRSYRPDRRVLHHIFDIVENTIKNVSVFPRRNLVRESTPPRPPRAKSE